MKHYLTLLLCLPFIGLIAQNAGHQVLSAQGDYSKGESITLSWTIGDLVTETAAVNESLVTQGFQQPILSVREVQPGLKPMPEGTVYEGVTPTMSRVEEEFSAAVYPNPFGSDITVEVLHATPDYTLEVYDQSGTLVSSQRSSHSKEVMDLRDLPPSQYLLQVRMSGTDQMKAFQIIKSR